MLLLLLLLASVCLAHGAAMNATQCGLAIDALQNGFSFLEPLAHSELNSWRTLCELYLADFPDQSVSFPTWNLGYKDHMAFNGYISQQSMSLQNYVLPSQARRLEGLENAMKSSCSAAQLEQGHVTLSKAFAALTQRRNAHVAAFAATYPFAPSTSYTSAYDAVVKQAAQTLA